MDRCQHIICSGEKKKFLLLQNAGTSTEESNNAFCQGYTNLQNFRIHLKISRRHEVEINRVLYSGSENITPLHTKLHPARLNIRVNQQTIRGLGSVFQWLVPARVFGSNLGQYIFCMVDLTCCYAVPPVNIFTVRQLTTYT